MIKGIIIQSMMFLSQKVFVCHYNLQSCIPCVMEAFYGRFLNLITVTLQDLG